MDAKLRSLVIGFLLLLLPVVSQGLYQGQSTGEVLEELGPPNGKRTLSAREIWVYSGDITLEFVNGELVRSKGLDLMPPPVAVEEPAPLPVPAPVPSPGPVTEAEPIQEDTPAETVDSDEELVEMAENLSNPEQLMEETGWEEPSTTSSLMESLLAWTVPTFLQWIFLLIAFKWVGAEAMKFVLLIIAIMDRLVIAGVRWFFLDLLDFPTTFHADFLLSFIVMLGLITSMTHAKQLPTAIKVVVASKVAAFIAGYVFVLFILHNL